MVVPIEEALAPEDVLVLEFAYTQTVTLMASFIKQMAIAYGRSISPTPLRYAILAYGAFKHPCPSSNRTPTDYFQKASSELLRRVMVPARIQDSDVFAAMILAWLSICTGHKEMSRLHGRGCMSLLGHMLQGNPGQLSDIIAIFTPLVVDNMSSVLNIAGDTLPVQARSLNFNHRFLYYKLLCQTGFPQDAWRPPEIEVTYNTLRGALGVVLHSLQDIALFESRSPGMDDKNALYEGIFCYIDRKLEDDGFKRTFSTLRTLLSDGQEHQEEEYQMIQYLSIGYMSLRLLQAISECQDLLNGINGHPTAFIGAMLHTVIRTAGIPLPELYHYRDLYYVGVTLSGMLLRPTQRCEGIDIVC